MEFLCTFATHQHPTKKNMAISSHIINLTALALKDRVLTYTERQTIMNAAMQEGVSAQEINAYIDRALEVRLQSYSKEELGRCPGCGHGVPLIADTCPFCGHALERQTTHQATTPNVPPPYIPSAEADIIKRENQQTAAQKRNIKTCPDCGAPFPLISNICTYCGHILHEQQDSELNVQNLINNIKQNIETLQSAPSPTLKEVLIFRSPLIMCLLAAITAVMSYSIGHDILTKISSVMFLAAIVTIYAFKKEDSPVAKADNAYYDAIHSHEMYTRTVDSLYGDNQEASDLLKTYAADIDTIKRNRNKNRNIIALGMIAVIMGCLAIPAGSNMTPADKYQANRQKYSAAYSIAESYKTIQPYPGKAVNDAYSPYLRCEGAGVASIDVINISPDFINMHLLGDEQMYILRISGIRLESTGKKLPRTDTCQITITLLDKDGTPIKFDQQPLIMDPADDKSDSPDNLTTAVLGKGTGSCYADFVSKSFTRSARIFTDVINRTEYFTITCH